MKILGAIFTAIAALWVLTKYFGRYGFLIWIVGLAIKGYMVYTDPRKRK